MHVLQDLWQGLTGSLGSVGSIVNPSSGLHVFALSSKIKSLIQDVQLFLLGPLHVLHEKWHFLGFSGSFGST